MLCRNPFVRDPSGKVFPYAIVTKDPELALTCIPFPCGQCLPCRINKRRLWLHRLLLESLDHPVSSFITLTYDDDHLPSDSSLHKEHIQLFIKRLRKQFHFRYYICGEYGPQTLRPHYHGILFGFNPIYSDFIHKCWNNGFVQVSECNSNTCQYVAGYVTKKFIKKSDSVLPEFSLMSRKPGLGFNSLVKLAQLLKQNNFPSIPSHLSYGRKHLPFDRFSRNKLSQLLDFSNDYSSFIIQRYLEWRHSHDNNPDDFSPLVNYLKSETEQRYQQILNRNQIFNQRNSI